ncbi:hypothetical protein F4778DRAFT_142181 [Xylariomycetidae sp. FL2044]|nr:hypothetical protein F4778DRAFT_142181 [Xylariomycetidae sp. FL2044]
MPALRCLSTIGITLHLGVNADSSSNVGGISRRFTPACCNRAKLYINYALTTMSPRFSPAASHHSRPPTIGIHQLPVLRLCDRVLERRSWLRRHLLPLHSDIFVVVLRSCIAPG